MKPAAPDFPHPSEDAPYLANIAHRPVRPIFIMGLHRSGTTFLYSCLAKSFPLANLSLYHLFYYSRLLKNLADHNEAADRAALNQHFLDLGIADRGLDGTAVNADTVEEYGFLLRQQFGSFRFSDDKADFFQQMCQKLQYVQPGSEAVLLKNPWDTGNAAAILQHFPNARFIYITREPIAVLNSMLNALLSYLQGPQRYLELLLSPSGSRKSYYSGYLMWRALRGVRAVIGERAIARLARPMLAKALARQLLNYRREIASLPPARALEVDYQRLVGNPGQVMEELGAFIGLPLRDALDSINVQQRLNLNPVLQGYAPQLQALIDSQQ